MSVRLQRLLLICLSLIFLSVALTLILVNSKNNLVYFFTPTELIKNSIKIDTVVRIGGFVKKNSIKKNKENNTYTFTITDNQNEINVEYTGILPDLFNEQNGAVIEGNLINNKKIIASKVFAKHDENYMPASIKKQIKKANYWKKNY